MQAVRRGSCAGPGSRSYAAPSGERRAGPPAPHPGCPSPDGAAHRASARALRARRGPLRRAGAARGSAEPALPGSLPSLRPQRPRRRAAAGLRRSRRRRRPRRPGGHLQPGCRLLREHGHAARAGLRGLRDEPLRHRGRRPPRGAGPRGHRRRRRPRPLHREARGRYPVLREHGERERARLRRPFDGRLRDLRASGPTRLRPSPTSTATATSTPWSARSRGTSSCSRTRARRARRPSEPEPPIPSASPLSSASSSRTSWTSTATGISTR